MAGKTKTLIDHLVAVRSRNNPDSAHFVRAHLILKGINPSAHTETSEDDPKVVAALERMIREFE